MGPTGSGKTTFANAASGSTFETSFSLGSCTAQVQMTPAFDLKGRTVRLIDTPGFDDTNQTDHQILEIISEFLAQSYNDGKRLSGVVYLHRISDFRMGGVSTRSFRMFRNLCGDTTLGSVTIATTMWEHVKPVIGQARENELASQECFFKAALDKGAHLVRYEKPSWDGAKEILERFVERHPVTLRIQEEMVDEGKGVRATVASQALLDKELAENARELEEARAAKQKELEDELLRREEEARRQAEVEEQRIREEKERLEREQREAKRRQEEENERLRRKLEEQAQREREERDRAQRAHEEHLERLRKQLAEQAEAAERERRRVEAEIREAQRRAREAHNRRGFFERLFG